MHQENPAAVDLPPPRWLRGWAVLTVALTLLLLTLGAAVTTLGVGMVDRQPVRSPLYLVGLIWEEGGIDGVVREHGVGMVIEHTHRFVGWLVGIAAIVLAVGLWFQPRRWLRWMGLLALAGVSLQGVLGMLRIELQTRYGTSFGSTFALIHGATAQLVVALLASIAVWTSASWQSLPPLDIVDRARVRRATLHLAGLIYVQLLFGGLVRHKELALGMRVHILLAFAVIAAAMWTSIVVLRSSMTGRTGRRNIAILWGLLVLQVMLGLETFLSKFNVRWPATQERVDAIVSLPDLVRSLHYLVGAMTFAAAVALAVQAHGHVSWFRRRESAKQLEGAL
jgi:cytochrome c oxidase assembly protein subunit 15